MCGDGNKCAGTGWVRGCNSNPVQNSSSHPVQYDVDGDCDTVGEKAYLSLTLNVFCSSSVLTNTSRNWLTFNSS